MIALLTQVNSSSLQPFEPLENLEPKTKFSNFVKHQMILLKYTYSNRERKIDSQVKFKLRRKSFLKTLCPLTKYSFQLSPCFVLTIRWLLFIEQLISYYEESW